jgi:hypothetical protein
MRFKAFLVIAIATCLWLTSWMVTPPAFALTQIKLSDLTYEDCPPEMQGMVTSGGAARAATCYMIKGKAKNPSGKPVYDADVYGRIYDANNNPVMQNRTRVGSIDEVPPGESEFAVRVSVPSSQPTPLQLEQFKASGFTGRVQPRFEGY